MVNTAKNRNVFTLGSQIGGPDAAIVTRQIEQQLRDAINIWTGDYCAEIREFAFLLRVDGQFHTYTKEWNINGAQKAKRKKDWVEVEIGVPESWWRKDQGRNYKRHLAEEIEKGLHSMIQLLQKNGRSINSEALLTDWEKIKRDYLAQNSENIAPDPFLAEAMAVLKKFNLTDAPKISPQPRARQMPKLYMGDRYWEAWHDTDKVTIHWGVLGNRGETRIVRVRHGVDPYSIIEKEALEPRAQGYQEVTQLSRVEIRYLIEGMGNTNDVDKRHQIQHLMDECLGWTGLGHCAGGEMGSGTMSIFCLVVDVDKAQQIIAQELQKNDLLRAAKIILRSEQGRDTILFPTGSPQSTH
ncbi:MAG TPA: hypothetical protein VK699_10355 [Terriglobales bacterium]|jgi:hypothetical protein|nr:hypothetical protein [Terriglobales bacterium]